jgi:PQQ-like domain
MNALSRRTSLFAAALASVSLVQSCLASASAASSVAAQSPPPDAGKARLSELAAEVEKQYVIGPAAATELGYRIAWQARLPLIANALFKHTHLSGDGIFVVDELNSIARLRASDGAQIWRVSVANPVDIFRGIDWIETPVTTGVGRNARVEFDARVYISTDVECFVLDGASGSIAARQGFKKLPTTTPLRSGKFLIYGTLGGQIVWHHAIVGSEWRANSVDSTVRGSLARSEGLIVAVSERGLVIALDEADASRRWAHRTYGGVLASPTIAGGKVFVASTDQYLWCFDLRSGAVAWKYFTQAALKSSPFPVADVVLQFVPGEGLVCFNVQTDRIDGDVRWRNADVVGVPMGMVTTGGGDRIVLWDLPSHTLTLVDPNLGSVSGKLDLPAVAELQLVRDGEFAGDIFATATDGRVLRLAPKFRTTTDPTEVEKSAPAKP